MCSPRTVFGLGVLFLCFALWNYFYFLFSSLYPPLGGAGGLSNRRAGGKATYKGRWVGKAQEAHGGAGVGAGSGNGAVREGLGGAGSRGGAAAGRAGGAGAGRG